MRITPLSRIRAADIGAGRMALLVETTGALLYCDATARRIWRALRENNGDVAASIIDVARYYGLKEVDVRDGLLGFIGRLEEAGGVDVSVPIAMGDGASPRQPVGLGGLVAVLMSRFLVRTMRFSTLIRTLDRVGSTTRRAAEPSEIAGALRVVDAEAGRLPLRIACMERSTAALLILAARRRSACLHFGVACDPFASHAWLSCAESPDVPVGEPATTHRFVPIRTVNPLARKDK